MVISNSHSDGTLLSCVERDPSPQTKQRGGTVGAATEAAEAALEEENTAAASTSSAGGFTLEETWLYLPAVTSSTLPLSSSPHVTAATTTTTTTTTTTQAKCQGKDQQRLWLPGQKAEVGDDYLNDCGCPVDEYLASLPAIQASRSLLFGRPPPPQLSSSSSYRNQQKPPTPQPQQEEPPPGVRYNGSCSNNNEPRILYISQREVGYAVPSRRGAQVIMSDRATTCHILLLRSTGHGASPALVSCAHLDAPLYDSCLQDMFQRHVEHHRHSQQHQKKEQRTTSVGERRIQMDIHVVGGFLDPKGRSRDLSAWLVYQLAHLAADWKSILTCTLRTCIVTSLNHYDPTSSNSNRSGGHSKTGAAAAGGGAPLVRGLACDVVTGRVFCARCDTAMVMGPDILLRQARLWSQTLCDELVVVHTVTATGPQRRSHTDHLHHHREHDQEGGSGDKDEDRFVIAPFELVAYDNIHYLLSLRSDAELLRKSSTSPLCEEDDYCDFVRQVLSLFHLYRTQQIFPNGQPRIYQRRPATTTTTNHNNNPHPPSLWNLLPLVPTPSQQQQRQQQHRRHMVRRQQGRSPPNSADRSSKPC